MVIVLPSADALLSIQATELQLVKEAEWAKNHLHGFAAEGVAESADAASQGLHEFHHGGEYGNATGDYWDDSHPTDGNHGELHGFVNDRSYHLDKAESAQHNAEWHEKRAEAAMARGDLRAAKEHTDKAASFRKWEHPPICRGKVISAVEL